MSWSISQSRCGQFCCAAVASYIPFQWLRRSTRGVHAPSPPQAALAPCLSTGLRPHENHAAASFPRLTARSALATGPWAQAKKREAPSNGARSRFERCSWSPCSSTGLYAARTRAVNGPGCQPPHTGNARRNREDLRLFPRTKAQQTLETPAAPCHPNSGFFYRPVLPRNMRAVRACFDKRTTRARIYWENTP